MVINEHVVTSTVRNDVNQHPHFKGHETGAIRRDTIRQHIVIYHAQKSFRGGGTNDAISWKLVSHVRWDRW